MTLTPFREQVQNDFANVLLNTEEFGRICSWNGEDLQIAEDANMMFEGVSAIGVNADTKKIYCRDIDLDPHPVVGEEVNLDGETWYVVHVQKPFAHLIITLRRNVT
jgi:hypothetical protein